MNNKRIREIDFMYIIKKVIYSWKAILVFGIISMVALTSLKYYTEKRDYINSKIYNQKPNSLVKDIFTEEEIKEKEKKLPYSEKQTIKTLQTAKNQYDILVKYMADSIAFNVDGYNNEVSFLHYYVNIDKYEDKIKDENHRNMIVMSLLKEYYSYVNTSDMPQQVLKQANIDMEPQYLKETISISNSTFEQGVFVVSLYGVNKEQTQKLTEAFKQVLTEKETVFSEGIAEHDLVLVDEYYSVITDSTLLTMQNKLKDQEVQLIAEISELKQTLNKNQKIVYAYHCGTTVEEIQTELSISKPALNVKYAIIGMIIGVALTVAILVVIFISRGRLDTVETLEQTYDLKFLGDISKTIKKKNVIDNLLITIFEKKKGEYNGRLNYFIENIKYECRNRKTNNILFVSTLKMEEELKAEINSICNELMKEGLHVGFECGVYSDTFVKSVSEYDNIVLLEKLDGTICEDLERTLAFCRPQKEIIGVVLV